MKPMAETISRWPWADFPYADPAFAYRGARLKAGWEQLHRGDREPYPEADLLDRLASEAGAEVLALAPRQAAEKLQEGWRAYHRGDFAHAFAAGLAVGPLGHSLANKAVNIYATYLEPDPDRRLLLFQESAKRAEALAELLPELANAWYFGAQALGRYGQGLSVAKALAAGLGGKIKNGLEKALDLDETHADAHIALGAWHSEVIAKVGVLAGALTYGASKDKAVRHFERALVLNPGSAVARIEYARGLLLLYGRDERAKASALYREAAACEPHDAMERLDQALAATEAAA